MHSALHTRVSHMDRVRLSLTHNHHQGREGRVGRGVGQAAETPSGRTPCSAMMEPRSLPAGRRGDGRRH